ncbi:MAG: phosphate butyryltransferase [Prevotella sp.]|nr:phosphate butyryltransferase [Prevotella sp.]
MNMIKDFAQLSEMLKAKNRTYRIVAIEANDEHTQEALHRAEQEGWAVVTYIHEETPETSAAKAVAEVREGKADVIMKGLVNTDVVLRAILNKQNGILPKGGTLTHVSAMKVPTYHKILFVSDVAVIPNPTLEQREVLIQRAADVCRSFGVEKPRVALLHCTEKVSEKFPITLDYVELMKRASEGAYGDIIVHGPIDAKCACDKEADEIKGIHSPLEGDADILIMPDIEAGNVFYKTLSAFTQTDMAVMLQGAQCPVVVTSRGDTITVKYNSLAMACLALEK